eukprot:6535837-Prorocentrum_lima.AAC.1
MGCEWPEPRRRLRSCLIQACRIQAGRWRTSLVPRVPHPGTPPPACPCRAGGVATRPRPTWLPSQVVLLLLLPLSSATAAAPS